MPPPWTGGEKPPRVEQSLIIKEFAYDSDGEGPPQNISEYTRLFQLGSSVYYLKKVPWHGYLPYILFLTLVMIIVVKVKRILVKSSK